MDPNSAIGQAEGANDALAGYFNALNKFLGDATGTVIPPNFDDFVNKFDYSELHRLAKLRSTDTANYLNGATIENIHMMIAISREYNLRKKSKIGYYSDATSESGYESDYYSTMKTFWVSMLSGISTNGATS